MSPLNGYIVTSIIIALLTIYLNNSLRNTSRPDLKLYYFNGTGRAEPIRLILAYAEIPFEDIRISFEDWAGKYKEMMPWGQVPVLEINGKLHPQSVSLARYAGKLAGLTGKCGIEDLEIDAIVDTFSDMGNKISDLRMEQDETKRKILKEKAFNDIKPYLQKLDKRAQINNGYIAIDSLTWADLFFVTFYENLNNVIREDVIAGYQNLIKVKNNVLSIETVKNYLKNRPADNFGGYYDLREDI